MPDQEIQTIETPKKNPGHRFAPGHPRYGGRKKGNAAKARELADSMGIDPLQWMMDLLQSHAVQVPQMDPATGKPLMDANGKPKLIWEPVPLDMKVDCAKTLCGYLYPKLMATQVSGPDEGPLEVVDVTQLLNSPQAAALAQEIGLALAAEQCPSPAQGRRLPEPPRQITPAGHWKKD